MLVWDDDAGVVSAEKSKALLERPTFLRASFVVRLDSMIGLYKRLSVYLAGVYEYSFLAGKQGKDPDWWTV